MVLKKVYFIRHQAAGILTDVVFIGAPPSQEALDLAAKKLAAVHGTTHPKSKEPYWLTVQEGVGAFPEGTDVGAMPDAKLPEPPAANGVGSEGASGLPRFEVSGTGTVTPGDPATADERAEKARVAKGR